MIDPIVFNHTRTTPPTRQALVSSPRLSLSLTHTHTYTQETQHHPENTVVPYDSTSRAMSKLT
eukprot:COSAG01_NODE_37644_length_500_cov_8.468828_1_plen_62_part_01